MYMLFKNLRIGYNVINLILLAVFIVTDFWLIFTADNSGLISLLLILAVWIAFILNQIIFNRLASEKYNKIVSILNAECDPIKYLNVYFPLTQKNIGYKLRPVVLLNLTAGYLAAGDFGQARKVLSGIDTNQCNASHRIFYHCHWASMFIGEGNFAEAEKALNFVSQLVASTKLKPAQLEMINNIRNLYAVRLNIEKGCFEGAEQIVTEIYNSDYALYYKVSAQYTLAQLYIKQNRTDKAVEAMKYVAEKGNTLNIAQKARDYLKTSYNNTEA